MELDPDNPKIKPGFLNACVLNFIVKQCSPINWPKRIWENFESANFGMGENWKIWRDYPDLIIIFNEPRIISPEIPDNNIGQTQKLTEKATNLSMNGSAEFNSTSDVIFLFDYHPKKDKWSLGISPKHDKPSSKILNLKSIDEKNEAATAINKKYVLSKMDIDRITDFAEQIEPLIQPYKDLVICVMPKSKKAREPSGIRMVAKKLCQSKFLDGTDMIDRPVDREPRHTDGNRDYHTELSSLRITDAHFITGKNVLILDDITTTGNSLKSGKALLLSHGAKQVIMLALGKTSL